jgi:O-methyltransferase
VLNFRDDAVVGAWLKRLSALVLPRYVLVLDQVINNARVGEWLKQNRSAPLLPNREALYDLVQRDYVKDQPIDYLEFGVMNGASIRYWADMNRHPESRFFGFDTFTGLPEAWGWVEKAGAFDCGGKVPQIDDPRVHFEKGLFQDSLPGFLERFSPKNRLVIHQDADLYSSTMYSLTMLDRLAVAGTILLFDDFSSPLHEFRALNDYCSSYRRKVKAIGMTGNFAQQAAFIVE